MADGFARWRKKKLMQTDVYKQLAQRLDEIPNGFPSTESGAELRLLAKLFSREEAAIASVMSLQAETVGVIAEHAGVDMEQVRHLLKTMSSRGLIEARRNEGRLEFKLIPFVVGFYETQLPRMDAELAALFERYLQDSQGGILHDQPAIHRVIPVGEAVPFDLEIFPYEKASQLLENARSWAVRDCICRVQQRLVGKGCDRPVEICLSFAPVEGAFDNRTVDRAISKEEALQLLRLSEEAGLVHSTGNYRSGTSYICNCCTCCCGIMRGVAEFNIPTAIARSDFLAVVDADLCIGCGDCIDRCQFGALTLPEALALIDEVRCMGCGLCTTACTSAALHLVRRPAGQVPLPPIDEDEWNRQRLQMRGK